MEIKNLSIEDEIMNHLSQEISRDIDEGIMSIMITETGWTRAPVTWAQSTLKDMWIAETGAWCHLHATGNYKFLAGHWHFERAEDATAFILKWMGNI